MLNDRLRVGVVTSPHGVHGEVNVYPTTDDIERFERLAKCYIDNGKAVTPAEVDSVKYFKGMAILHFKGIDDRDRAEALRKCDILVDRCDAVELEEGEYFICDIIGLKVIDENHCEIGIIEDVIQTGANDVYSVKNAEGKEILIPSIKDCIIERNFSEGYVKVHLLPGLLEL